MAAPNLNLERVAVIVVDAFALGDATAAAKWKISKRTVERYRARMATDRELSRLVTEKKKAVEADWSAARIRFLRRSIAKLEELVDKAGADQIREVAGAIKIVGELEVVSGTLNGEQPGIDSAGAAAPAHARFDAQAGSALPN